MWVKTLSGALLNLSLAETVMYDDEDNYTKAWIRDSCCVIAEGNAMPFIQNAIIKHENYVRMV